MNNDLNNALENYNSVIKHTELLDKIKNPANESDQIVSKIFTDSFSLTEIELKYAPKDFQDFIRQNGFVKSSEDKYGITPPYEDFKYNLDRLKLHLKLTKDAYYWAYTIHDDDPKTLEDLPDYDSSEEGWEKYKSDFRISKEIFYEHALVSLLSIFEVFINNTIKWIYTYSENSRKNKKVKLSYSEILDNFKSTFDIVDLIVSRLLDENQSWNAKYELLNEKPHKISIRKEKEYNLIRNAVNKRNLLIHNKGIVNNKFIKENKNSKYENGDRIIINEKYYNQVQSAIKKVVKYVDKRLKEIFVNLE